MNLYELPATLPPQELCETLCEGEGVRIERIISSGQCSPPGFWYDQAEDEWVCLLQGRAVLDYGGGETQTLSAGEWLLIPAHKRHRVAATSAEPPCIWLCVYGSFGGRPGMGQGTRT